MGGTNIYEPLQNALSNDCIKGHPRQVSINKLPAKSYSDFMFVYKVIRDLWSIDHLCINPIHRINKELRHCHSWLARQLLVYVSAKPLVHSKLSPEIWLLFSFVVMWYLYLFNLLRKNTHQKPLNKASHFPSKSKVSMIRKYHNHTL